MVRDRISEYLTELTRAFDIEKGIVPYYSRSYCPNNGIETEHNKWIFKSTSRGRAFN